MPARPRRRSRLFFTADEAAAVEALADRIIPPDEDPRAAHFERRSFAVISGSMPARVAAMLVADVTGRPDLSGRNQSLDRAEP